MRAAAVKTKDRATPLVHCRVEYARTLVIDDKLSSSRIVVHLENVCPRLATVSRFVNTTLGRCSPKIAGRGNPDNVRIRRMYDDPGDRQRLFEAHVLPGLAGVH